MPATMPGFMLCWGLNAGLHACDAALCQPRCFPGLEILFSPSQGLTLSIGFTACPSQCPQSPALTSEWCFLPKSSLLRTLKEGCPWCFWCVSLRQTFTMQSGLDLRAQLTSILNSHEYITTPTSYSQNTWQFLLLYYLVLLCCVRSAEDGTQHFTHSRKRFYHYF